MSFPVDITFHPSWWNKHVGINFNKDFFEDIQYRVECDINMRKALYDKFGGFGFGERSPQERPIIGSDLIAAGYLFSAMLGCDIRFSDDRSPEVISMDLEDEAYSDFVNTDFKSSTFWKNTIKQLDDLKSKYGYALSDINLQGVQNIALDIRGSKIFMDYYQNQELARGILSTATDTLISACQCIASKARLLSGGVTGIILKTMPDAYITSNCTVEMISNDCYEEFLLEYDNKLSAAFQPFGVHHCGQTMEHVVNGYSRIDRLSFAEVGAGSDIKKVREALPDIFLNLRYSPVTLKNAKEDGMMETLWGMVSDAGDKFSVSCVGIDGETEDSQVELFLQCAQNVMGEKARC